MFNGCPEVFRGSPQAYQMMELRGVRPSIATFGTLITAASDAGDLAAVKQVWAWLEASGMEINTTCMNALVNALVKQARPIQSPFPSTIPPLRTIILQTESGEK